MKNKKFKAALVGLVCVLAITVCPAPGYAGAATQKDETVYVNLSGDGSVSAIYVVNAFEMDSAGMVTDYGNYKSVKNLTTTEPINTANGVNTVDAPQGRFYYQGEMSETALPWNFDIDYLLNGEATDAQSLAGVSGDIEIRISVQQGDARYQSFYDKYVLQISYTLDAEHCTNVSGEDANIVAAGKNISVGYTVMQAADPATYVLKASVTEFEMSAIQIKALHTGGVSIDTGAYTDRLDEAQSDFTELADGVEKLADAGGQLASASGKFNNGLGDFEVGAQDIADASGQISAGINNISGALSAASAGSSDALALAQTLSASSDPQVQALAQAYIAQYQVLASSAQGMSQLKTQYQTFDAGLQSLPENAATMADGYGKLNSATHKLANGLDELDENVSGIPDELQNMRDEIDETIGQYNGGDFVPVSFVNGANHADSVLFVIKTDKIGIPDAQTPEPEPAGPQTFFDKLLDLFGLYKGEE